MPTRRRIAWVSWFQIARNWLLGLVAVFVGTGPLMVALLNPSKDLGSRQDVTPFLCALNVVMAIWIGLGLVVAGGVVVHVTVMPTDSISQWPDLVNGRGKGWATPFSSMVRHRKVNSPAASPGSKAAQ